MVNYREQGHSGVRKRKTIHISSIIGDESHPPFYPVCKSEGKGHPRTAHESPEGEQMYSSTLPSTSALDGMGGKQNAPAALPPRKKAGTHCVGG